MTYAEQQPESGQNDRNSVQSGEDIFAEYIEKQIETSLYGNLPEFKPLILPDKPKKKRFLNIIKGIEEDLKFNIFTFLLPRIKAEIRDNLQQHMGRAQIDREIQNLALLAAAVDMINSESKGQGKHHSDRMIHRDPRINTTKEGGA
ncbi:MAG TPA: hypothetical protein VKO42_02275 [Patescibacteria group bacterium]|nr:hypothetical protein [Patescibacteria group bacterium]